MKGISNITIAAPYQYGGLLIVSSGYVNDLFRPIYGIRPGADGDISLLQGDVPEQEEV